MVSRTTDTYDPNGILAGDFPREGRVVTIASSAALTAGAVLGRVTASGSYLLSATGAGNGSETPSAILAEDADASGGDAEALVYFSGSFDAGKLTFGTGHDADTVETALRAAQAPIFLKTAISE
ncbi:MAG: head decoration protein [Pseudomonadota bacterium]